MSRRLPRPRLALVAFAAAAALVVLGLVLAGLRTIEVRTFALRVQDASPVAVVRPGRDVCEGEVTSPTPAHSVGIFGTPSAGHPTLDAALRTRGGQLLTSGSLPVGRGTAHFIALDHPLPGGVAARLCLRATGGRFSLLGGAALAAGVKTRHVDATDQFALVLARRSTFLGSLGTAFTRAAIFRPDWVGAWTFWVLLVGIVATLGLAAWALAAAAGDEEESESR